MGNSLISLAPAKGTLGSRCSSTCCSSLDGWVGNDSMGELLLGFGEAGTCPSVLRVDLGDGKMNTDRAVTSLLDQMTNHI